MPALTIRENILLAPYTTLGVGGPARFLAEATTDEQVRAALDTAGSGGWPLFVLGGGSNVLVADSGFPGLVLRMATRGIETVGPGRIRVAAGQSWDSFVCFCVGRGLAGIECLSGIPGTVGATPIQNVGAYGQDVSEVIRSVRVLDRQSGTVSDLDAGECGFAYRTSIFNTECRGRHIVLSVTFELQSGGRPRIAYPDLQRFFGDRAFSATLEQVRDAVLRIRSLKGMVLDPGDSESRTAGSFFRNPIVSASRYRSAEESARRQGVLSESETFPRYDADHGTVKVPAAWLIERAGFQKGYGRDGVFISSRHALALTTRPGATAAGVLDLASEIRDRVAEVFGILLELEPVLAGF